MAKNNTICSGLFANAQNNNGKYINWARFSDNPKLLNGWSFDFHSALITFETTIAVGNMIPVEYSMKIFFVFNAKSCKKIIVIIIQTIVPAIKKAIPFLLRIANSFFRLTKLKISTPFSYSLYRLKQMNHPFHNNNNKVYIIMRSFY